MITIVGAGLAGLAIAFRLKQAGLAFRVLEARTRPGGRILSTSPMNTVDSTASNDTEYNALNNHQDLGPTWVWPYAQPVVTSWLKELSLELFEQYDKGDTLIDRHPDNAAERYPLPSQYGSARITGGTFSLVNALYSAVRKEIQFDTVVQHCEQQSDGWALACKNNQLSNALNITTSKLVIATPPRLAANLFGDIRLAHIDASLQSALEQLSNTETWMAPHAKVVMFFDQPFWRQANLSGRVVSQVGPLAEIHDHCSPDGNQAALFGFSAVPWQQRESLGERFIDLIYAQLGRCFGDAAPRPSSILIKDWAQESFTSTEADRNGSGQHPHVVAASCRDSHAKQTLWFAASETAQISPGLIEGALARADQVADVLTKSA